MKKFFKKNKLQKCFSSKRDWIIILLLFLILFAFSTVVHLQMIEKINSGKLIQGSTQVEKEITQINEKELRYLILKYAQKEERFLELKSKKPLLIDPFGINKE